MHRGGAGVRTPSRGKPPFHEEPPPRERRPIMRKLDAAAMVLVIVGALNWGLVALAEFDLVAEIFGLGFGQTNVATRIVYGL
ncbi:MAG: DUF378 domain-containing protein, partial [Actinomycetota bacterium]